jgi:hypothetical protein
MEELENVLRSNAAKHSQPITEEVEEDNLEELNRTD